MKIIENLKWRYATKKFDTGKKVSEQDLLKLQEAVNLAATSYGLQPFKILIIENSEIRERLKEAAWGQNQLTEASHIVLFCNFLNVGDKEIDSYLNLRAEINNVDPDTYKEYGNFMKGAISSLTPEQMATWTSKQTYIALGTLLAATAELKIDSCPMEGFDKDKFDNILGLKERGLASSVMAAIGYRDENDPYSAYKKVRKPLSELFEKV